MKKTINLLIFMMILSVSVFAQNKTVKFKVSGKCGMCESRIEKAAKAVEGVSKADWDSSSKMIELTYDESKVKVEAIQKAIAKVGHDTPLVRATDEAYNNLPGCCKYERDGKKAKSHHSGGSCKK